MKLDKGMLMMFVGVSLFLGFVLVATAVGGVFPSVHKLTAWLICRGEVEVKSVRYSYRPGEVTWQNYIYCNMDGTRKDITLQAFGTIGLLASAIIFAILAVRKRELLIAPSSPVLPDTSPSTKQDAALELIEDLGKLRDANVISEVEYEKKKADILKDYG